MSTLRRTLTVCLPAAAAAQTPQTPAPGGVRYAPTAAVGNSTLQLNGACVRYKAVFKV
jgi:hypothetical protein